MFRIKYPLANILVLFFTLTTIIERFKAHKIELKNRGPKTLSKDIDELQEILFNNSNGDFKRYSSLISVVFNTCFKGFLFECTENQLLDVINGSPHISKKTPLHFTYIQIIKDYHYYRIIELEDYYELFISKSSWEGIFLDFKKSIDDLKIIRGATLFVVNEWEKESDEIFSDPEYSPLSKI